MNSAIGSSSAVIDTGKRMRRRFGSGSSKLNSIVSSTRLSNSRRGSRRCKSAQPAPATTPWLCTMSSKGAREAISAATRANTASCGRSTACC